MKKIYTKPTAQIFDLVVEGAILLSSGASVETVNNRVSTNQQLGVRQKEGWHSELWTETE